MLCSYFVHINHNVKLNHKLILSIQLSKPDSTVAMLCCLHCATVWPCGSETIVETPSAKPQFTEVFVLWSVMNKLYDEMRKNVLFCYFKC